MIMVNSVVYPLVLANAYFPQIALSEAIADTDNPTSVRL